MFRPSWVRSHENKAGQLLSSNWIRRTVRPTPVEQLYETDQPMNSHLAIRLAGLTNQLPPSNSTRKRNQGPQRASTPVGPSATTPCQAFDTRTPILADVKSRLALLTHASHDKSRRHRIPHRLTPRHTWRSDRESPSTGRDITTYGPQRPPTLHRGTSQASL